MQQLRRGSSGFSAQSYASPLSSPQLGPVPCNSMASSGLSHLWFQSQVPTLDNKRAGKCRPLLPREVRHFSAKGAGLDHPSFQVEGEHQGEVAVSGETRAGGAYLLAVLFLPAALAPSACKRNPKHLHQPRVMTQILPTAVPPSSRSISAFGHKVSWSQSPAPFLQAEKICPQR